MRFQCPCCVRSYVGYAFLIKHLQKEHGWDALKSAAYVAEKREKLYGVDRVRIVELDTSKRDCSCNFCMKKTRKIYEVQGNPTTVKFCSECFRFVRGYVPISR